tara:strand:+ start:1446 stop:1724 length:279 start_codon:yes stop_codon:yes gene_type:complete
MSQHGWTPEFYKAWISDEKIKTLHQRLSNMKPAPECNQQQFNDGIMSALHSLSKTHEGRLAFLEACMDLIKEELDKETLKEVPYKIEPKEKS